MLNNRRFFRKLGRTLRRKTERSSQFLDLFLKLIIVFTLVFPPFHGHGSFVSKAVAETAFPSEEGGHAVAQKEDPNDVDSDPGLLPDNNNPFGLVNQEVHVYQKPGFFSPLFLNVNLGSYFHSIKSKLLKRLDQQFSVISLNEEQLVEHPELPLPPFDIGSKVAIAIDKSGDVHFKYGNLDQIIKGLDIQSFDRDSELLVLLSKQGKVHIVHLNKLNFFIFQGCIPVFKAGVLDSIGESHQIRFLSSPEMQSLTPDEFHNRYGNLPLEQQLKLLYLSQEDQPLKISRTLIEQGLGEVVLGDIAVNNGNEITQILPRQTVEESVAPQARLLEHLVNILNGSVTEIQREGAEISRQMLELLEQDPSLSSLLSDNSILKIVRELPLNALEKIRNEIATFSQFQRQTYNLEEWDQLVSQFNQLILEKTGAINEEREIKITERLQRRTASLVEKVTQQASQSKAYLAQGTQKLGKIFSQWIGGTPVQKIAKILGVSTAVLAGIFFGADVWHFTSEGLRLITDFTNENTVLGAPSTYKTYLAISTINLTVITFGILACGAIAGKLINQTMARTITKAGSWVYAIIVGSIAILPIHILGQKNLPLALRGLGASKFYKGLSIPSYIAGAKRVHEQREKLLEEIARKKRVSTAALLLAFGLVAKNHQIDPALLLTMEAEALGMEREPKVNSVDEVGTPPIGGETPDLPEPTLNRDSPVFEQVAQELKHSNLLNQYLSEKELWEIKPDQLAALETEADNHAKRYLVLWKKPWYKKKMQLIQFWRWAMENTPLKVLNPGYLPNPMSSYEVMRQLMSNTLGDLSSRFLLRQYEIDLLIMPAMYSYVPGSFSYANPDSLYSSPDGLFAFDGKDVAVSPESLSLANPQITAEIWQQQIHYLTWGPAKQTMVFGRGEVPATNEYQPLIGKRYNSFNLGGSPDQPSFRRETLMQSLQTYFSDMFNFRKMHYEVPMMKDLVSRQQFLFATLLTDLITKLPTGMAMKPLISNLIFNHFFGFWMISWVWILLQQGLVVKEDLLLNNYNNFVRLIVDLDRYIRTQNWLKAVDALKKLLELYPENKLPRGLNKQQVLDDLAQYDTVEKINQQKEQFLGAFEGVSRQLLKHGETTPPVLAAPHKGLTTSAVVVGTIVTNIIAIAMASYSYNVDPGQIPIWVIWWMSLNIIGYVAFTKGADVFDYITGLGSKRKKSGEQSGPGDLLGIEGLSEQTAPDGQDTLRQRVVDDNNPGEHFGHMRCEAKL